MPITIYPTNLKYKTSSGTFESATSIKGDSGFSPTISITDITGGHRITITDATGPHSFDVMNGEGGGAVQDVQVDGVSVLDGGVANIPRAGNNTLGLVGIKTTQGISIGADGTLATYYADTGAIKPGANVYRPIVPGTQHVSTFYGLAKAAGAGSENASNNTVTNGVGSYSETSKSKIHDLLNAPVTISGTTPSITALPGIRYVCGEVSTLDITPPASGCFDVMFESGSTPTALTISNPTGTTVEWLNDFDPTNLSANTVYEINLLRIGTRYLGVAVGWT